MKRHFYYILFLVFGITIGLTRQNIVKDKEMFSRLALCNIEALADSESNPGQFNWCKTGSIVSYGMWVLHCGNCDMQMVSYATGEGYCYKK